MGSEYIIKEIGRLIQIKTKRNCLAQQKRTAKS